MGNKLALVTVPCLAIVWVELPVMKGNQQSSSSWRRLVGKVASLYSFSYTAHCIQLRFTTRTVLCSGAPSCPLLCSGAGWIDQFFRLWTSLSGPSPLSEGIITYYSLLTTYYYLLPITKLYRLCIWMESGGGTFVFCLRRPMSKPNPFTGLSPSIWQHFGHSCEQLSWESKVLQKSSIWHIVDHWLPTFLV